MLKRLLSLVLAALIAVPAPALPAQAAPPSIERPVAHAAGDAAPALPRLAQRLGDTIPPLYMLGGDDKIAPVALWNAATDAFPSAILSHSRTSLATMFDSTGKLTYAPNNLLTYSNTFSNAAWAKSNVTVSSGVSDPFGGTNAWTLTATAGSDTAVLYNPTTLPGSAVVGQTPLMQTFWVKRRTGSGTINWSALAVGVGSSIAVTSSWTQVSLFSPAPGGGTGYFGIRLSTNGDAIDIYAPTFSIVTYETTPRTADQVITTAAAYYGPRIDYDPNTLAVKGLLIEEARTNIISANVNSGTMTTAGWVTYNATATANFATGIDGTSNADKLAESASAGNQARYYAIGAVKTANAVYTFSAFLKQGTQRYAYLTIGGAGGTGVLTRGRAGRPRT